MCKKNCIVGQNLAWRQLHRQRTLFAVVSILVVLPRNFVRGTPYSHASSGPRLPNRRPPTAETAGATPEYPLNISNNILRASPNISDNIHQTPDPQSPNPRTLTSGIAGRTAETLRTSTLDTSGAHSVHQHLPSRPRAHSRWHQACDQARNLCRQRCALETAPSGHAEL